MKYSKSKFPTGAGIKGFYYIWLYMTLVLKGHISNVNSKPISDHEQFDT